MASLSHIELMFVKYIFRRKICYSVRKSGVGGCQGRFSRKHIFGKGIFLYVFIKCLAKCAACTSRIPSMVNRRWMWCLRKFGTRGCLYKLRIFGLLLLKVPFRSSSLHKYIKYPLYKTWVWMQFHTSQGCFCTRRKCHTARAKDEAYFLILRCFKYFFLKVAEYFHDLGK